MVKVGAISLALSLAVWPSETFSNGNRNIILCQVTECRTLICLRNAISLCSLACSNSESTHKAVNSLNIY